MSAKLLSTFLATSSLSESIGLPKEASTVASSIDYVYKIILFTSAIFFVGIILTTVVFVIKYRRRGPNDRTSPIHENLPLELTWILIPSVLLGWFFYEGFRAWMPLSYAPANSMEVRVTGSQWKWSFSYPRQNVRNSPELVVPLNKPVKLIMSSQDVLHSFFVPEFRVKRDVLPGRYTMLWFQATKLGSYRVLCTEYCGQDHSEMIAEVRVVKPEEFDVWVDKKRSEGVDGKELYANLGCNGCHSIDGKAGIGPTFKGLFGKMERVLENGVSKQILVDDNYIRTSILEPNKHIVEDFKNAPPMTTYQGRVNSAEISALIDFIKSLGASDSGKK